MDGVLRSSGRYGNEVSEALDEREAALPQQTPDTPVEQASTSTPDANYSRKIAELIQAMQGGSNGLPSESAPPTSGQDAQGPPVRPGLRGRRPLPQQKPMLNKPLPPLPNAAGKDEVSAGSARKTKVDGRNDPDKFFKDQAEHNNEQSHVSGGDSGGEAVLDNQLGSTLDNQLGITNPDDDRGRRLYAKASFNQLGNTEQKGQKLNAAGINLGTLTGKGDVRTNERLTRVYAGDGGVIGLSSDLKAGERQSVEGDKSSYALFAGAQFQRNAIAARYEGEVNKGPVRIKPKAEALAGVNTQLELQAQAGKNPNLQLDAQAFVGARVDAEVGIDVLNRRRYGKPETSAGTTGAQAEGPKRLLKMKARVDGSVGAQANVSLLAGKAQKDGVPISGGAASVDLFAGARARGKLTAEAAGVGVAAQVEALAGVGVTATAGLKKEGSQYKVTHGFGAAAGLGVSVLHEVTFNPALAKEAVSAAIPNLRKQRPGPDESFLDMSGGPSRKPNKLRKPRPEPKSFVDLS